MRNAVSVASVRLSLTAKLAAISLLLVASVVTVAAVAWAVLRAEVEAGDVVSLGRAQRANLAARTLHDTLHADVLHALLADHVESPSSTRTEHKGHRDAAALRLELARLADVPVEPALRRRIAADHDSIVESAGDAELIAQLAVVDRAAALARVPHYMQRFEAARAVLADQAAQLERAHDAAHEAAHEASEQAQIWLVISAALAVIIGWGAVALIARSIRRSLMSLRDVAGDIAAGQLDRRSDGTGSDEVGELAGSVNRMAATLQDMIERLRSTAEHGNFSRELTDALEMADDEAQTYDVVARAMAQVSTVHRMELLVADASDAHLECAATHPMAGGPGCGVDAPFACIAVRRGHMLNFPDGEAINACPRLRDRDTSAPSAHCVPVSFMGRALGVLHAAGNDGQPLGEAAIERLAMVALHAGGRLGTVRAFERTQLQASTDALTGLSNRRTIEHAMRRLKLGQHGFAFVMCDLDHFKRLNDTYGHPAGDDALRAFADVVRNCTREHDLIGRWGGEEFAFVLPGTTAEQALRWTDRVRQQLAQAVERHSKPAFTASFGVVESGAAASHEALVQLADLALYRAKAEGRDRAVVASAMPDAGPRPPSGPRPDLQQPAQPVAEPCAPARPAASTVPVTAD